MLQQFTWLHFLVAITVLSIIYYSTVILYYYNLFLSGKRKIIKEKPLPHIWEKGVDDITNLEEEISLIGDTKPPEGMSKIDTSEFAFIDENNEYGKMNQLGLVPDVLQELKLIFENLAKSDGTKNDFKEMMITLSKKFPKILTNPNISHINTFIIDNAPFYLSAEELENIWV